MTSNFHVLPQPLYLVPKPHALCILLNKDGKKVNFATQRTEYPIALFTMIHYEHTFLL
jgi:hypothetical protein